ncbi:hypothetical protein Tco_0755559 [Tanacetum coccineum]
MSTSTHPIIILSDSYIEDVFSSTNTPDYTPASPDYSPALPGNTSSDPSEDLSKDLLASLAILTILLSWKRARSRSSSSTSALPQVFKIGESSHKTSLERHEEQIKTILNHIDELPLELIEHIEDKYEGLAPAMSQAAIRKLVADSVVSALEAQVATMANTDNTTRNTRLRETPVARKCSYKEFMSCQPFNFKGTEGAVGLIRWFEQTELVFSRSNYTEDCKVKFATGTLTKEALSWWNSFA